MFKFYNVKYLKPSQHSVQARLPEVYKKYLESLKLPPSPVHYVPESSKYVLDPVSKQKKRTENRLIPLKFPKEADEGIWGGEGVIKGFIKEKRYRRRLPNYWVPNLKKTILYSEILNSYLDVTVTERTLRLIDQNHGFDNYILGTPVQDLKSQLALSIRRKMLLALTNNEQYHSDEATHKEVQEKYKKYMIPKDEAEWFGLTLREAIQKQRLLEEEVQPVPLKHEIRARYIDYIKKKARGELEQGDELEEEEERPGFLSFVRRLNPFAKSM